MILLPVVKQTRWNWTLEHELSVHPAGASIGGHPPAPPPAELLPSRSRLKGVSFIFITFKLKAF